jgi:hypothetical protein
MADDVITKDSKVNEDGVVVVLVVVDSDNEPIRDNNSVKQRKQSTTTDNSHLGKSRLIAKLFWFSRLRFKHNGDS